MQRRSMLAAPFAFASQGCTQDRSDQERKMTRSSATGRLTARPRTSGAGKSPGAVGLHPLSVAKDRDALLFVPTNTGAQPRPLVVSLHGAGGNAQHGIRLLEARAEAQGFLILAPPSRRETWDVIVNNLGPDVDFINAALDRVFETHTIDPARIAISGFSDGASYALTLGLPNGDLFSHILAFSPGFTAHPSTAGSPAIFISHGKRDTVLPIDPCSRRIVPRLRAAGLRVDYREFDGGHTVPPDMSAAAVQQILGVSGQ
jgi:predicted esterase